ncbi:MAG: hypothetical protein F4Y57_03440 [Acidobacteria bacterium]|nr:hypothetical protein [Acidobacteriota bacterium]
MEVRSYLSESRRGQHLARGAVYSNRRRIRGASDKRLLRFRDERLECRNAHLYGTARPRRVHLRRRAVILKRLPLQVCCLQLGLLMRQPLAVGTPRGLQYSASALADALRLAVRRF